MLAKTYINKNLNSLKTRYNNSKTLFDPMIYSKLAVIELCGWIETSIDEIIEKHRDRLLNSNYHIQKVSSNISHSYGFHSKKHLKLLLSDLIGYKGIEHFESVSEINKIQNLYRELNELSDIRNQLAHTYIKGYTLQIDSPSRTLSRFENIYSGLKEIDQYLTNL